MKMSSFIELFGLVKSWYKIMTLFKKGMWVFKKSWGCSGLIKKRVSRYVWQCDLAGLSFDGCKQIGFVTARQVKSEEVEILNARK